MIFLVPSFWCGCGQQSVPVRSNAAQLEQQYVELTPYWEMIFNDKDSIVDNTAAIGFSKYYKEARWLF